MKTIFVTKFKGMADDRYSGATGEFGLAKHFDTQSYPDRLQPLRGMTTDTASTGIGNIIVASNGLMYGVGTNSGNGRLWQRSGYGVSDLWQHVPTNDQLSGAAVNYDLLVQYLDITGSRNIFWASTNLIVFSDPAGTSTAETGALTFTSIGQGLVHPKDKILYIPYRTATAQFIAKYDGSLGAPFNPSGTLNPAAWNTNAVSALPSTYRAYGLSYWNNYLVIPQTFVSGSSKDSSLIYLWDRNTSVSTLTESIPWGDGLLQVVNNLNGWVIGISVSSANASSQTQDYTSAMIKVWNGENSPTLVKEIRAQHLAGPSAPTIQINPRVNFIYQNRLYFSMDIVYDDNVQTNLHGLWSVGKDRQGAWNVNIERNGNDADSNSSVFAAAITGDFVSLVHTAVGTLTVTNNGVTSAATYSATSYHQSVVNPEMEPADRLCKKKLMGIGVYFHPLPTSGQIVLKYRVDSNGSLNDWVTCYTYTTAGGTSFEAPKPISGQFTDGRNYEFRLESTGGAVINGYAYKYNVLPSLLLS